MLYTPFDRELMSIDVFVIESKCSDSIIILSMFIISTCVKISLLLSITFDLAGFGVSETLTSLLPTIAMTSDN